MADAQKTVVIVGAGPTGLTLAAELCRLGVKPLLLDKQAEGANTSRAAVVHARTLEVLEPLDVVPDILKAGLIEETFYIRERSKILASISFKDIPSKYQFIVMIPQNATEAILLARLKALGGSVERRCEVMDVTQGVSDVEVRYKSGNEEKSVRASWVVGCDGMHSVVREQSGIPFEGSAYAESFLLGDVEMNWPLGSSGANLFFSALGITVVVPLPGNHYRIVATVDQAPAEPSISDFQKILDERGPENHPSRVTRLIWSSRFHIHHRVARSLRKGRVMICGDAAHVHSPAGGQGMNTGIQDAMALADALKSAMGDVNTSALDAWEKKRLEIAHSVVGFTDVMTKMATSDSKVVQLLRNAAIGIVGHVGFAQREIAEKIAELKNR